jgi:hypothetical protein
MITALIVFIVAFSLGVEIFVWKMKKDRVIMGYPQGTKEYEYIDLLLHIGRYLNLTAVILALLKFLFW